MTLTRRLQRLIARLKTASEERERLGVAPAVVPPKPRVPGEYLSLYTYLEQRYASKVVLSFGQMEDLLGFALPAAARVERDWWTAAAVRAERHSDAWTAARRTATPNLPAGNVAFDRLA